MTEQTAAAVTGFWPTDIRDPSDEMLATGFIHIEAMDTNRWWIGIHTADGKLVHVNFWTNRAKIYSSMEIQGESDYWQERMSEQDAAIRQKAEAERDAWKAQCHSLAAENERLRDMFDALAGKEKTND